MVKLFLILLLATVLRLYLLGSLPAGFHRDEAFLGYNAYSILKTGRDMNGNFLPLHLRSFINSPAGYSYLAIPPVAMFGLNEFSVRLPSAVFGIATILVTYFLVFELFKSYRLALISSFLLAISPWHINLSRTAIENVVVVFLITVGCLLFLRKRFILAFMSFSISMLLYQAPRAFLPFFVPLLIFLGAKSHIRTNIVRFLIFIILPIAFILASPALSLRLRTVGIPASGNVQLTAEEAIREDGVRGIKPIFSRIFHNKPLVFAVQFLENYFSHFSYAFLFTDKGLPERYRIPGAPLIYLIELPLLIIGAVTLINKRSWESKLLLGWILIAPVGSSLAFDDVPNLQRTLLAFPALSIIAAIGLEKILKFRNFVTISYCVSLIAFLHAYYIHLPVHRTLYRHEGYKELVAQVQKRKNQFTSFVITNRETAPTVFFLFYNKYDPAKFIAETRELPGDDRDRTSFDNYVFTTEECPIRLVKKDGIQTITGSPGTLYANFGTCEDVPGAITLSTVKRGDSSAVFKLVIIDEQRKMQEDRPESKSF